MQTNAPDIRFLDADGVTWLNYQIERWDKTLDSAEVWVQVPQVDGNSDHDYITLYYNDVTNGAVTDNQCGSCVFSTSNSHTGVWHLSEEIAGTGTASVYKDATGNAYHGTGHDQRHGAHRRCRLGAPVRRIERLYQSGGGNHPYAQQLHPRHLKRMVQFRFLSSRTAAASSACPNPTPRRLWVSPPSAAVATVWMRS